MIPFAKIHFGLILSSVLVCIFGVVALSSFDQENAKQQLLFVLVGAVLFLSISAVDFKIFFYLWKYSYLIINLLLVLLFVSGQMVKGSYRWFSFGVFSIQPSELSKVVLILALAWVFSIHYGKSLKPTAILKSLAIFAPIFLLVFLQPDLGTSLVFVSVYLAFFLFSKLSYKYYLLVFVLIGFASSPAWHVLKDYQQERIYVFLNPARDPMGTGYNVLQSTIAVGSGMFFGKGYGNGTQSKLRFLPEFHTDFIFASFSEEWGFLGVIVLLSLYAILLFSILHVLGKVTDAYGFYICLGVFFMFLTQIVINIGMNVALMPVTGIPLPLFSYGGSSLITSSIALGLVNSIYIRTNSYE